MFNSTTIHGKDLLVNSDEFSTLNLPEFAPLKIKKDVADLDREIALIKKLRVFAQYFENIGISHGGYVPILVAPSYTTIHLHNIPQNIAINMQKYAVQALSFPKNSQAIIRYDPGTTYKLSHGIGNVIISDDIGFLPDYTRLVWGKRVVYVKKAIYPLFENMFYSCIKSSVFTFDNLINMLIMVKNAGDDFRAVLENNKKYIDTWTILDTGSTDNTLSIIRDVLADIPGKLYQEPFINFRDSRNRLLELAGEDCAFNIMLDDTYTIHGNIREFLTIARADDEMESLSIYIKDTDVMYSSNRITKPERKLKYVYTIHEIIQTNLNGCIPVQVAYIQDRPSPYMKDRTTNRKKQDLELLNAEIKANPEDSRLYYYLAETYLCLEDWENAYTFYKKRTEMKAGFSEETQDSLYKMAVIAHLNLKQPWELCHALYLNCYNYNPNKIEALFMIGSAYVDFGADAIAYLYLKHAIETPILPNTMNNRYMIYSYHLPKTLLPLAKKYGNDILVKKCEDMLEKY